MIVIRYAIAACLILSATVLSHGILVENRFAFLPLPVGLRAMIVWVATLTALVGIFRRGARMSSSLRVLLVLPALLLGVRYWIPRFFPEEQLGAGGFMGEGTARAQERLRLIASAQEQYRIRTGRYSENPSELLRDVSVDGGDVTVRLARDGARWWTGVATVGADSCEMRVGEPGDSATAGLVDGVAQCTGGNRRWAWSAVRGAKFRGQPSAPQDTPTLAGVWLQHRADAARSGIGTGTPTAVSWESWLSGEIRSSPSIAGDQLFLGAHGNGEVASFRMSTGELMWRVRAPNWIHHEPVVRDSLVAYGFGNNERWGAQGEHGGSPPSGFEVVDRRTGRILWRRYTDSPAMGAPLFADDLLIGIEARGTLRAWRAVDGTEIWSAAMPDRSDSPMMNPVPVGNLIFVGTEPARWCAFDIATGTRASCGELPEARWGAGHTSPTVAGRLVLFSFAEYPTGDRLTRATLALARGVLGLPLPYEAVAMVAVEMPSGKLVWRTSLGGLGKPVFGHVAGTPTVIDTLAVVPLPLIAEVAALDTRDGQVRWRARVAPARGSVTVFEGRVFTATTRKTMVVLDLQSGEEICEAPIPGNVDRAGLSIAGATGVLVFSDGRIKAAPVRDWMQCGVRF
jgi:outer membrane protein assembly factor BamB